MRRTRAATSDGNPRPNEMPEEADETSQTVAAGQLRAIIERIERLIEEKKSIQGDISDVFAEAKGTGFDTTAIRALIKLRAMDQAERQEREGILDLYKSALGMA